MNWRSFPSLAVALLAGAGCPAPAPGDGTGDEPLRERIANQARAVAALSEENRGLLERLRELQAENEALRRELPEAPGGPSVPESGGRE